MPAPVMVVVQGRNIAPREQPWSTIVKIASKPLPLGKPVIRSMAMCENGLALITEGMWNGGVLMRWVRFLFCLQVAQPLMYSVIHALVPGQKYSLFIFLIVSSLPGCPLNGPSCQECMSSRFSPWSGGITRRCDLVSRQNGACRLSTRSMGKIPSHSFMRV